ncbi:putative nucleolar protein required for 60S ribosome biogenesis [Scheffersomyces amazonensis]|uniref:putative nucleolar protein required for 60S ribosome biogenesis n=1 Tax=Scheffersomyces amazonensis TaxID=1078765 RepID=UPI00315D4D27
MGSKSDQVSLKRIHVGNISPKLAEKPESLTSRFEKFGKITIPLELHTKPITSHYFGFMSLEITNKNWDALKRSLNGIQFMGLKLSIEEAKKSSFQDEWKKDVNRPDTKKEDRLKQANIYRARQIRILESHTPYSINPITNTFVQNSSSISSSSGYMKSAHTYNNASANTKNKPPSHSLVGQNSYSSWSTPSKTLYSRYSNISGNAEIIKGRHRITKRPHTVFLKKLQTMRLLINGELKQIKSYKTKLWGIEKSKTLNDLTWKFSNGYWKSGDEHILEKLKPPPCGISGVEAMNYGKLGDDNNEDIVNNDGNEIDITQENLKNKSVLASLFDHFDFEKPVEVEEDTLGIDKEDILYDSKGRRKVRRYDYELEGGDNDDNESESDYNFDVSNVDDIIQSYTANHEMPQQEVYYSEDDEGNDLDLDMLGQQYTTEAINQKYNDEHVLEDQPSEEQQQQQQQQQQQEEEEEEQEEQHEQKEEEESSEDEFIPTFGSKPTKVNDTETLRSLFNPSTSDKIEVSNEDENSNGFKLALSVDDDDIDETKAIDTTSQQELLEQIKAKQEEQLQQQIQQSSRTVGLFWGHFESPFLQSQSQLSKIGNANDHIKLPGENLTEVININGDNVGHENNQDGEESAYEKWFWNMRGELSRECKRRRRDVLRVFRKKSKKVGI